MMTRGPHKDHSRSPLDAHRNAVALQLFLTLPPGSAVLFPTVFTEAVAGQPKDHRALATWVKIPEEDRHRIGIRPYVRTHATLIRQDGVPVGVILTKLGDYPTIFLTAFDPRDGETLPGLLRQRNLWHIVFCGGEQIRNISSENEAHFWRPIQDVAAGEPAYTPEQYHAAENALLARSDPDSLWAHTQKHLGSHPG